LQVARDNCRSSASLNVETASNSASHISVGALDSEVTGFFFSKRIINLHFFASGFVLYFAVSEFLWRLFRTVYLSVLWIRIDFSADQDLGSKN
jgi:hypothetical protein